MFTGIEPWSPLSDHQISYKLFMDRTTKPEFPICISTEATEFLNKCLESLPDERFTAEQLLMHNFIKIQNE